MLYDFGERLTSHSVEVEFLPYGREQNHIELITFSDTAEAGEWGLFIDDIKVGDLILYPGDTDTLRSIQDSLDSSLGSDIVTVTGNSSEGYRFVFNDGKFHSFETFSDFENNIQLYSYDITFDGNLDTEVIILVNSFGFFSVIPSEPNLLRNIHNVVDYGVNRIESTADIRVRGNVEHGINILIYSVADITLGISVLDNDLTVIGQGSEIELLYGSSIHNTTVQQGSGVLSLTADLIRLTSKYKSALTRGESISEVSEYSVVSGSSSSFSLTLYGATIQEWVRPLFTQGMEGILYYYPRGKRIGEIYQAMRVVIDSFEETYPFRDKVEVVITGTRQGKPIARPGTIITSI